MGGTTVQGFDPAALLVIVALAGVGAFFGLRALRRRTKIPSWMKLRRYRKRVDVIRRDLDRLVEYVGELPDSELAVSQPYERGRAAMAACHWDQAVEHFEGGRGHASSAQLVPLLVLMGACHYMQGRLDDAIKEFGESARLAEREKDTLGRAAALANIGVIHHEYGEFGSALTHLNEALAIARESGNEQVAALCLSVTGNIHRDKGQPVEALKSHEDALAIYRRMGDEPGAAGCLGNTASVRRDQGELDKALELYAEALETTRKAGDNFGYAVELGGIGGVYRDKGDMDRALKFHEEALAGSRHIGFTLGVATELGNVGLIMEKRGAHGQAVPNLAASLAILFSTGVNRGQIQGLLGLSRCDDALGRERVRELLEQVLAKDGGAADMLERVDQIRRRRPWPLKRT